MSEPLSYAKWKKIEVSDDEDETHPNIHTPSLIKWRHETRLKQREQRLEEQRNHEKKRKEINERRQKLKAGNDISSFNFEKEALENDERQWKEKDEEIKKKERLRSLDVDDLTHEGKISKTSINKKKSIDRSRTLTQEEQAEYYKNHQDNIKKFGMFQHYDDTQKFLEEHMELVCEETANYLIIWCIDLEIEQKHRLMEHVSHQAMIMQFICELSKSCEVDPRQCVRPFFIRMKMVDNQHKQAFDDELHALRERIQKRARQKIEEYEQEEQQKRLGPGGLDPYEVMELLPKELQECFESRDVTKLQSVLSNMSREEANHYLDLCIKSGLWVPNAKEN